MARNDSKTEQKQETKVKDLPPKSASSSGKDEEKVKGGVQKGANRLAR
jgi:hypothetical protein